MLDSAILIGHGSDGVTAARRAAALADAPRRVFACEPEGFVSTLETLAGLVAGNSVVRVVHLVHSDDEKDMRAALASLPEVVRTKRGVAVHVDQWVVAMVGQTWEPAELDLLTGADAERPPYSLMVVSRSNEARALLSREAEVAMASDVAHALTSGPLRQSIVAGLGGTQVGAGAAAAYYRREPLLAGILAFHGKRGLLDPILMPWPSEGVYRDRAGAWFQDVAGGSQALGDELDRGANGPRPREVVAVDPDTGSETPPELLLDTLETYIDLMLNDRLTRAFRSVDEVAARQRDRLRERLYASTMDVLHESRNLGATGEFLEYLAASLGNAAEVIRTAASQIEPEFDPEPLLKELRETVTHLPHRPAVVTRALGIGGVGVALAVLLGAFVAPLTALAAGAAAGLGVAGFVMLGAFLKRHAVERLRRRILDELQRYLQDQLDLHVLEQLFGVLSYLARLVGRREDLESGCLGGLAKMRASSEDYLQHLDRVIAERFHEEFTPTELSVFLPRPEDSPTEALVKRFSLPVEFDVTEALLRGITDGMDRPSAFAPGVAFSRFYARGTINPPKGLWNNLSELLTESPQAIAAVGELLARGTAPLAYPDEDVPQERVARFAYLSRDLPENVTGALLEFANQNGSTRGDDPNAITWVSVRTLHDAPAAHTGGSDDDH